VAIDPVCGMFVDIRKAPASAILGGRTYYFCALECKRAFLDLGMADEVQDSSRGLVDRRGDPLFARLSPDGEVTILFTDVQESTALMERMGEQAAHAALRAELCRQEQTVQRHRGSAVKRLGDGIMAAFATPGSALHCAIEIQSDDARRTTIPIRIGLHTGEVIVHEGDYFGRTVAMAARLTAHAEGGEIVADVAFRSLADLPEGWRFSPPRRVRLKGFPGRRQVVRVECCQAVAQPR
jgi:adenylate cyclase